MRAELRSEVLGILKELTEGNRHVITLPVGTSLRTDAVFLLEEHGALEGRGGGYRITISGYDYYDQLKAPRAHWVKKNWFPVAVLAVSSVVTVVANVIAALLR